MAERTSYVEGTPSWTDLMTTDPEGARAFYGALFGWEFEISPYAETGNYTTCRLNGKSVCGMAGQPAPAGMPTVWTTYFAVDDADKTAERATEHGGTIQMPPMDVMDQGRMAMAADREGAMFGLWQAGKHTGAELVNVPGTLVWNELSTSDLADGTAFYTEVLGLTWADYGSGGEGPAYKLGSAGGRAVLGAMEIGPDMPAGTPAHWGIYFAVEDAAAAAAKVTELGGAVQVPVFDTPQGPTAVVSDPQGGVFSLIAMVSADD